MTACAAAIRSSAVRTDMRVGDVVCPSQQPLEAVVVFGQGGPHLAGDHGPAGTVDREYVARSQTFCPTVTAPAAASTSTALAPTTAGLAIERATTAAWLANPPVDVRTPTAAAIPWMSHGRLRRLGADRCRPRADAERAARELDRANARDDVHGAYEDFLGLNQRTLDIFGNWQVGSVQGEMALNHHTDETYDAGVLARLAAVDAEVQPVCARLAGRLHRFSSYGPD